MRTLWAVSSIVLLSASCGGKAAVDPASPATGSDPATTAATGLASITAADLRAHVELLASDDYRGRETLQDGYELAADHLARELESYGLAPMPGVDGFKAPYTLYELGYDAAGTKLSAGGEPLEAGTDFTPFEFSDEGTAEAEVVFAGYGITAPDLSWDDYEDLEVKGKVVLVLRHSPNEDKPNEKLQQHALFTTKAMNAQKHGAVGMLLVTDPRHHQDGEDLRLRSRLMTEKVDLAARGSRSEDDGKEAASVPFLAMQISQAAAGVLVEPTGTSLIDIQKSLDDGGKASAFRIDGVSATMSVTASKELRELAPNNVAGFLEGSDPQLKHEWVVIGAHFDHLGGYVGAGDTIYNGADDNASGTAGMLELAQAFASRADRPKRSILFIGFSGEEKGLLGSRALVDQKLIPIEKIVFMLNLDMIGRNPDKPVAVVGDGYSRGIKAVVEAANADVQLPIEFGGSDYAGNSDHHPFYSSDVPFLFLFTGLHEDYHQLSDHADKIDFGNMEKIARVAYGTVDVVASGAVTPRFVHHVTWLGIEVQVQDDGAVITAVDDNSRGKDAGLAAGDVIRHFGEVALDDPKKVGERFREWEPGTALSLGVRRDGDTKSIRVERAKRGYLGVFPGRVTDEERKALGLGDDEGVKIGGLSADGPAGKAGILKDDILIRIHGLPVNVGSLGMHLARIGAGETVKIVVVRDGERITLDLVLGERPQRPRTRP